MLLRVLSFQNKTPEVSAATKPGLVAQENMTLGDATE
jgi:hypothetical protein